MKKLKIRLTEEAKARIKSAYKENTGFKPGREYARIVLTRTVHRKTISYNQVNETIIAALKAATASRRWLELLILTTNEITDAISQSEKIFNEEAHKPEADLPG